MDYAIISTFIRLPFVFKTFVLSKFECPLKTGFSVFSIEESMKMFLWPCSLAVPVLAGWVCAFVILCPGTLEGSTGSGSGFKASQKTGQRLKVSSDRLGEAGNRTCDPWFTRHRFIPYATAVSLKMQTKLIWRTINYSRHSVYRDI